LNPANNREARLPLSDAPPEGTVHMLDIDGHQIGLYKVAGTLHAIHNRCPHRGAPLCTGKIATPIRTSAGELTLGPRHSILRCPWHKWEFEIATGQCLVDERLRLKRYAVLIDGDEIVVTLDQKPQIDTPPTRANDELARQTSPNDIPQVRRDDRSRRSQEIKPRQDPPTNSQAEPEG
jgi:nitrite reductase/ring-hydroxylating ferredoxin subunit